MGSFHKAVLTGKTGRLIRLVKGGKNVDERDECGFTPLHVATSKNKKEIALLLIKLGANVHMVTENEWTTLHICAQLGEKEIAEALLEKGAELEAKDRDGCVALHVCASHGTTEVAILLLDKGAQVEARNRFDWTPLHVAAEKGRTAVVRLLLERKADKEALGKHSWRPLHLCAQENTVDVARALLQKNADVEAFEDSGRKPLHICAQFGSDDVAVAMIEGGAGVDEKTTGGKSALHICARFSTTRTAVALMDNGAAIDARDVNGDTALHVAVNWRDERLVAELLSRSNAEVINLQNKCGLTPLHLAVSQDFRSIGEMLVQAGARTDVKNNDGQTLEDNIPDDHWLLKSLPTKSAAQELVGRPTVQPVAESSQQEEEKSLKRHKHPELEKSTDGGGSSKQTDAYHPQPKSSRQKVRKKNRMGLKTCGLIVGIDFTRSNKQYGRRTFGGRSLHAVDGPANPYMMCLDLAAKIIEVYDDDEQIPCYGFGDQSTEDKSVFSFFDDNEPARGMGTLLERYKQIAASVQMSEPISFAPVIRQAMRDVYNGGMKFHVLLILAAGQVSEECLEDTKRAICEAVEFPLSIVVIGVGDGRWSAMYDFEDELPKRDWENFHFFELNDVMGCSDRELPEAEMEELFEGDVLSEIPRQYILSRNKSSSQNRAHVASTMRSTSRLEPPVALTKIRG